MEIFKWIHIVLPLLLCFPYLMHGEVVHITVLTAGYTDIENRSPQYQCYRSEEDVSFLFGRSAEITTNLGPPAHQQHPIEPKAQQVVFPDTSDWDTNGFGPFYCEASKEGRDVTRITTFYQRSDAKFIPSDGVFTKTVNVNDTGVVISMDIQVSSSYLINWRKDGGDRLDDYEGMNQITFSDPIQKSDEGIYETNYDTERLENRGGLYRLIVRECPSGRWGPPECYGICDKCYNGGVCDDKSGLCICPNNFRGPNCLDICRSDGGNRFGLDCEFRCTYKADPVNRCHRYLFCLPDPYGCSCDVGASGYECTTLCSAGTYGPGCTQTCHCAQGSCNIYSGVCSGGCATGWSGDNCQIPDVCEAGYYGDDCTDKCHCLDDASCDKNSGECPQHQCAIGYSVRSGQDICQECEGGTFGVDCGQSCHCDAQACETERGLCNGQCLPHWIQPDCQTGISRLLPVRVNPYQPSSITCYVEGNPLPDETSVSLYRNDGQSLNDTGISRRSSSVTVPERAVVFDVDSVYPQEYVCSLFAGGTGSLSITDTTFILPVIDGKPVILSTTPTTVRFQWNAWSEGNDEGDPPLIGYAVFVKRGSDYIEYQRVDHITTSATVDDLTPDTEYRFRVAAVREGPGGTGPMSGRNSATTLCGKPSATPIGVRVSATHAKQLAISWQPIRPLSAECRSGVTHYVIYYTSAGSTSPNTASVNEATPYIITGLETYMEYTIQITASNKDEESDRSNELIGKTLEEVPPAPINVNTPRTTLSSITVSWSTPLPPNINGNIQKYVIRYQEIKPDVDVGYVSIEVLSDAYEKEYTILYLPPENNYVIQVQTVNGVGSSTWSEAINARTIISGVGTRIPLGAVVGGVIGPLLIILLLILAAVFYRRRKRSRTMKAEPPTSTPLALKSASPQYENPTFEGKAEPHNYQSLNPDDAHTYQAIDVCPNIKGDHADDTHTYLDPTPETHADLDSAPDTHVYTNSSVVHTSKLCIQARN